VAHPQVAAFARLANGGEPPRRVIEGQTTRLGRTTHDIRYDALHDEILVGNAYAQALLTFRGAATGDEAPLRIIQGSHTRMRHTERAEVDPMHDEIFVPEDEEILVFPRLGQGDVAPIRVIEGPDTLLKMPRALAVDPVHNLIVISVNDLPRTPDTKGRKAGLLIFNRTDNGNVKPRAVIAGPKTGIADIQGGTFSYINMVQTYAPRGWIVLTHSSDKSEDNFVGVWSVFDNGDIPPRWKIGGPNSKLKRLRGVALIPKQKEVIVEDTYLNAVLTYSFPEIF